MAIVVEKTTQISSEPSILWGLLVNVESWKNWWRECIDAHTVDYRTVREGSKLELSLQPRHQKLTFRPVVDLLTEGKTLSFTHESILLKLTVVWIVEEGPKGARLTYRAVFKGFQVWVTGLFGMNHLYEATLASGMRGLKRLAERMI